MEGSCERGLEHFFCEVQTASWKHVSKNKASQNKNKMWWRTLDCFLDPKQTPATLEKNSKSYSKSFDETHSDQVWSLHFFSLEYAGAIRELSYLWPRTATSIDLRKQQTLGVTSEATSSLSEIHWEESREETQA